jgi:hypothetical protein
MSQQSQHLASKKDRSHTCAKYHHVVCDDHPWNPYYHLCNHLSIVVQSSPFFHIFWCCHRALRSKLVDVINRNQKPSGIIDCNNLINCDGEEPHSLHHFPFCFTISLMQYHTSLQSSFYLVWSTLNRYSYIIWDNYV